MLNIDGVYIAFHNNKGLKLTHTALTLCTRRTLTHLRLKGFYFSLRTRSMQFARRVETHFFQGDDLTQSSAGQLKLYHTQCVTHTDR